MFKRVEKRRRKQEEEEALGITEEMKEVLGKHDTDSDESLSSDDSDDSSDEGEQSEESGDENEEQAFQDDGDNDSDAPEDEPASGEDEDELSIPVSVAVDDPLYIVSLDPEVQACIVCPGKTLKNAMMIKVHKESRVCS